MLQFLLDSPVLLSVTVFVAKALEVSLSTVRVLLISRGYRWWAAGLGFLQVLLWIGLVAAVLRDLSQWSVVIAYAAGFTSGNYLGVVVEGRLAMGMTLVRVVSTSEEITLAPGLRDVGCSVTELNGRGQERVPVEVLLLVVARRNLREVLRFIEQADPAAVYTVSDLKRHRAAAPTRPTVA